MKRNTISTWIMFCKILMQTFSFYYNNSELKPYYKLSTQCKSLVEILLLALTKANYYTVRVLAFKTHFCILHESGRTEIVQCSWGFLSNTMIRSSPRAYNNIYFDEFIKCTFTYTFFHQITTFIKILVAVFLGFRPSNL